MRHSAARAKEDAAATWKTVKLGGWKRSELLVSNRRNSSHSGHQQSSSTFLNAFLLMFKWVNQEAITANHVLNLVIEIIPEIQRGRAEYIKPITRRPGDRQDSLWESSGC